MLIRKELEMWYVIQTITGKEKELVSMIENIVAGEGYDKCFVIQHECIWKIEGQYRLHIEPLFPSYVFVETDSPEEIFLKLKRVPRLAKLLGSDGIFSTVQKEEEKLLKTMIRDDGDYIVRRSLVRVDSVGMIISAEGALKRYVEKIVKKRIRKRSVVVEIPFLGENRRIQLGIRLEGDGE